MDALGVFLFCACIIGVYMLRSVVGVPSSFSLLPYQGGVLFRKGRPVREVGSGRHRIFVGREKIIFLDKRPIQVNIENRAVALADGSTAVYSFATSAEVRDVKMALYASANYTQFPAFITLCVARSVLNQHQAEQVKGRQAALTDEIIAASRSRLAAAGFDLLSFRFIQLSVVSAPLPMLPPKPPVEGLGSGRSN